VAASPRDVGLNVFALLRDSMPETMWLKVSAALEDVLDPEQGGDARLARQLEQTLQGDQERRQRAS
jgi:hypothetical protein